MPRRWINCRVIVRVCGLLLLGAVFTVAAAWGPAVRLGWLGITPTLPSVATSEELRWWRANVSPATDHKPTDVFRPDRREVEVGCDFVSMFSLGESPRVLAACYRHRYGLPLRALGYDLAYDTWTDHPDASAPVERHSNWHWTIDVHRSGGVTTITLPLTPIWSGFAIDTLFFAAASALTLAMRRWMIRRWRLKRGRCPACKYPIGTSPVCTECGEALAEVMNG